MLLFQPTQGIQLLDAGGFVCHVPVYAVGIQPRGGLLDSAVGRDRLGVAFQVVAEGQMAVELLGIPGADVEVVVLQVGLVRVLEGLAPLDAEAYLNEYVAVKLFRDNDRYKDDVYVAVNGQNCIIKRGEWVKIKRKFALVLDQSEVQDMQTAEYLEAEQAKFREAESAIS